MDSEEQNGFLEVSSTAPQPVGIYGWRKRCLYAFVLCLMAVVVINLSLTVWILRVLHFSMDGMGKLRIAPKGFKLHGEAEFLKPIYARRVKSEEGQSLYVQSNKALELLATDRKNKISSKIVVDGDSIEATCDTFRVQNYQGNTNLLIKDNNVVLSSGDVSFPGEIQFSGSLSTPTVRSPLGASLHLTSETSKVMISGTGGVSMTTDVGNVTLTAAEDIHLVSKGGVVHITSRSIVMSGVPKAEMASLSSSPAKSWTMAAEEKVFQLCVCDSGKVFLALASGDCRGSVDICARVSHP